MACSLFRAVQSSLWDAATDYCGLSTKCMTVCEATCAVSEPVALLLLRFRISRTATVVVFFHPSHFEEGKRSDNMMRIDTTKDRAARCAWPSAILPDTP